MQTFLLLADQNNPDLGTPHCPLCFDEEADYRALTDREVDMAWYDAAQAYNRVWDTHENPHQPGWQGIWCVPSWREKRQENLESQSIVKLEDEWTTTTHPTSGY